MNAKEAIEYIENYTWSTTRLGLGRTRLLLKALGDPQKQLRFVHVAGSNGKGSTSAMLASILRESKYRVGLYTSPHIESFCERINVDGRSISGDELAHVVEMVRDAADGMTDHPSQFELSTAVAMLYFLEQRCDIVVLEVGLGGELDSTNVIDSPEAAVITNIGLEHTEYLGNTLCEIASAKAGIIKSGCECVCYDVPAEAAKIIGARCSALGVPLTFCDFGDIHFVSQTLDKQEFTFKGGRFSLALLGRHQLHNAAVVLETVSALRRRGWRIPENAVRAGLKNVRWPARLEVLCKRPLFILDGAHNPQCAAALADSLCELLGGKKAVFLVGVLADKDYTSMLRAVAPYAKKFFCLAPFSTRALPAEKLASVIRELGLEAFACADVSEGISSAIDAAGEDGAVVSFGSLYLAGHIRSAFFTSLRARLRKSGVAARDALSADERKKLSVAAVERIAGSDEFKKAKTVLLYRAVRAELDVSSLISSPEAAGKRFAYPRCEKGGALSAYIPLTPDAWEPGAFGIPEPVPEKSDFVSPDAIGLVICPCVSFDETCGRIGMGAGYYDRFLPLCENAFVAAAAFEAQKAEAIFAEAWDVPMDAVFTERRTYRRRERNRGYRVHT